MRPYGIQFKDEMVRALLNTRAGVWPAEPIDPSKPWKWQTRRVIKKQPKFVLNPFCLESKIRFYKNDFEWVDYSRSAFEIVGRQEVTAFAPYGPVGRHIWVRESFCDWGAGTHQIQYKADTTDLDMHMMRQAGSLPKWMSGRYMPRKYSRLNLEVKNIRVQMVREISDADAAAEGIHGDLKININTSWHSWRDGFKALFNSIHGPDAWDKNEWVFVYDLMRL